MVIFAKAVNDAGHPVRSRSRCTLYIGAAACYGLAYVFILVLALRKGLDLGSAYSLAVWLVSAFLVSSFCGLVSFVIAGVAGRFVVRLKTVLLLWGVLTVLIGSALVFNAR